jgi:photosystem II stability/assembly factor-like uncharacterized protein
MTRVRYRMALAALLCSCGLAISCRGGANPSVVGTVADVSGAPSQSRWTPSNVPNEVSRLSTVRCLDERCISVGQSPGLRGIVLLSVDGGRTWVTTATSLEALSFEQILCTSLRRCVALGPAVSTGGSVYMVSEDAGESWLEVALPDGDSVALASCSAEPMCIAGGRSQGQSALFKSTDGKTWGPLPIPFDEDGMVVAGVSCPTGSTCWITGSDEAGERTQIMVSRDGGQTWADRTPPDVYGIDAEIFCISADECWLGQLRDLRFTEDGGQNWNAQQFPDTVGIRDLACLSSGICFATVSVGKPALIELSSAGWVPVQDSAPLRPLLGLDCVNDHCVAVGSGSAKAVYGDLVSAPLILQ